MTTYQVSLKMSTKQAIVQVSGETPPTGYTKIATTFTFPDNVYPDSYALINKVRDALYLVKEVDPPVAGFWPDNITDVDRYEVSFSADIAATALAIAPTTAALSLAGTKTQQLTATLTPTTSTDSVTYSTSDATKATVSSTGLVTGVAAGTATITATTTSGKTATCAVTVTA